MSKTRRPGRKCPDCSRLSLRKRVALINQRPYSRSYCPDCKWEESLSTK